MLLGLFRTGTNYTRTLLELNYHVSVLYDLVGWKHGLVPTYTKHSKTSYPKAPVLVVIKDPFAVLVSWFEYIKANKKNMKSNAETFSDFLHSKVVYRNDFSDVSPEYYFCNPVQMWNSVVWNHISFATQTDGAVLRYEDVLRDPKVECEKIAKQFNLEARNQDFVIPENITKNMSDIVHNPDNLENYVTPRKFKKASFFLEKSYLENFSNEDIRFVCEQLSLELLEKLRYDLPTLD